MTFEEYKNEKNPTWKDAGTVIITKKDCLQAFYNRNNLYIVIDFSYLNEPSGSLQFYGITYIVINGLCWTLDQYLSPKKISVFCYQES